MCPDDGGPLIRPSARSRVGERIDGKFDVVDVLGRGGMGVVYRARQLSMDREVAVKVLHPGFAADAESVKRFLREARAASCLNHPHVITVFDFGQTDDHELYMVMELLQGRELFDELKARGPLPADRVVRILAQVCDAVHHAHEAGLVHRDLKPENVFLLSASWQHRDFVKVLDFGVAKIQHVEGADRITRTGVVCGTPAYISPEQVLGEATDRRADVYSLGVMAYELLSGRLPFLEEQPMKLLMAHLSDPPPRFAEACPTVSVPPALEAVVRRCLSKNPSQRPPTARALAVALEEALTAGPGQSPSAAFESHAPASVPASASASAALMADTLDALPAPTIALRPPPPARQAPLDTVVPPEGAAAPPPPEAPAARRPWLPLAFAALAVVIGAAFFVWGPDPGTPASAPPAMAPAPAPDPSPPGPEASTPPPTPVAVPEVEAAPERAPEPEPRWVRAGHTRPGRSARRAPTATAAPAPTVTVQTEPAGATIFVDGKKVGSGSARLARPAPGETRVVTATRRGYERARAELTADTLHIDLRLKARRAGTATVRPPDRTRGPGIIE